MKIIEIDTWQRRPQFELFSTYVNPRMGTLVNVDVTTLRARCEEHGAPLFHPALYCIMQAVNAVPELRMRIRGMHVVEHERVGVTFTAVNSNGDVVFCRMPEFHASFDTFLPACRAEYERVRRLDMLEPDPPNDALVFTSYVPWFSPSGGSVPYQGPQTSSIPDVMFARDFEQGRRRLMPVMLTAHHGLVDGRHVGIFFRRLRTLLETIEVPTGAGSDMPNDMA